MTGARKRHAKNTAATRADCYGQMVKGSSDVVDYMLVHIVISADGSVVGLRVLAPDDSRLQAGGPRDPRETSGGSAAQRLIKRALMIVDVAQFERTQARVLAGRGTALASERRSSLDWPGLFAGLLERPRTDGTRSGIADPR